MKSANFWGIFLRRAWRSERDFSIYRSPLARTAPQSNSLGPTLVVYRALQNPQHLENGCQPRIGGSIAVSAIGIARVF